MTWIFGSVSLDAVFIIAPALLSLAIALTGAAGESLVYAFVATALIDSGHVYTTMWRTWLHTDERKSAKLYYILVPLAVAAVFTLWLASGLPYFWSFVVYATLHHHIRQFYGVTRWYQALNRRASLASGRFLYAFALLPIVAYHFRSGAIDGYYSKHDLFLFPNGFVFKSLVCAWALVVVGWITFEVRTWKNGHHELNRVLSVAVPAALYAGCFFLGKTLPEVLFPLLFAHGISYFGLMSHSLVLTRKNRFQSFAIALAVILGTSCLFGTLEYFFEDRFLDFDQQTRSVLEAAFIAVYLVPLFCHYIFDARIWKKSHREGSLLFGRPASTVGDRKSQEPDNETQPVRKIS
jgi:hypothetical protein